MTWWWFLRQDRKEAVARQQAQAELVADFKLPAATLVEDSALRAALLRIAQVCVRECLATPESARFDDEAVKRAPKGYYLAIGRVESLNGVGTPATNWYTFACDPALRPVLTELVESDPRSTPG
jgi:hypothetical protein